jgi:hypothetical protein
MHLLAGTGYQNTIDFTSGDGSPRQVLRAMVSPERHGEADPLHFDGVESEDTPVAQFSYDMIFPGYSRSDIAARENLIEQLNGLERDMPPGVSETDEWRALRNQLWELNEPGRLAPEDLVEYAKDNGIFVNEKYVSFDYDYNKLEGMRYRIDGSGDTIDISHGNSTFTARNAYMKFAYEEGLKNVFRRLLPDVELAVSYKHPESAVAFVDDNGALIAAEGTPPVPPGAYSAGKVRHVVSTERFDHFLNGLNDESLKAKLGATQIDKFLRTIKLAFITPHIPATGISQDDAGLVTGIGNYDKGYIGFLNLDNYDAVRFFMKRMMMTTRASQMTGGAYVNGFVQDEDWINFALSKHHRPEGSDIRYADIRLNHLDGHMIRDVRTTRPDQDPGAQDIHEDSLSKHAPHAYGAGHGYDSLEYEHEYYGTVSLTNGLAGQFVGYSDRQSGNQEASMSDVIISKPRELRLDRKVAYPDLPTGFDFEAASVGLDHIAEGDEPCNGVAGSTVTYWDCVLAKHEGSRSQLIRRFTASEPTVASGRKYVIGDAVQNINYNPSDFGLVSHLSDHGHWSHQFVSHLYKDFNNHIKVKVTIWKEDPGDADDNIGPSEGDPYFGTENQDGTYFFEAQPWYSLTAEDVTDIYKTPGVHDASPSVIDDGDEAWGARPTLIVPFDEYSAHMMTALMNVRRDDLEDFLLSYGVGDDDDSGLLALPGQEPERESRPGQQPTPDSPTEAQLGLAPPDASETWTDNEWLDEILGEIVTNVNVGSRVVYYTPPTSPFGMLSMLTVGGENSNSSMSYPANGTEVHNLMNGLINIMGVRTPVSQASKLIRNKSALLLPMASSRYSISVPTSVQADRQLISKLDRNLLNPYMWSNKLRGSDFLPPPYIRDDITNNYFLYYKNNILNEMAQSEAFKELFGKAINAKDVITFLFMYGLLVTGGDTREYDIIFNDTKKSLRIILKAALAGDDYAYVDKESQTASQRAGLAAAGLLGTAASEFAAMGMSFLLKMFLETPKLILKGLAELIDPHVVVGKKIRDVSGQVFQMVRTYDSQGTLDNMLERLQEQVDTDLVALPKPLRPKFKPFGFDLIGTLPYMAILPPGPLGWAYILFDLSAEELQEMFDHQKALEECILGDDPHFAAPPAGLGSDSENDQLSESPTSTWACADPAQTAPADGAPGGGAPAPGGGGPAGDAGDEADQTSFECE